MYIMINYCSNCGNKVQQAGANFCPKCGQNLKTIEKTSLPNSDEENFQEQEYLNIKKINLAEIKNNIKIYAETEKSTPVKLGDYLEANKNVKNVEGDTINRTDCGLPSGNELLKFIQKECSTSRDKSSEIQ